MSDLRDLYQEVILDHNKSPRNFRAIEHADRHAHGDNPLCGDVVDVYAEVEGGRITDLAFQGSGCAISQASASLMTDVVKGKSVSDARHLVERFRALLTEEDGDGAAPEELGKLAVFTGVKDYPMRVKCATLAWHTLAAALDRESEAVEAVTTEE